MEMSYRKKIVVLLCVVCLLCANFVGCGKKGVPKPVAGKYVSADGNSYIVLSNYKAEKSKESEDVIGYCDIQFSNVDLSTTLEYCVHISTSRYIEANKEKGLTEEDIEAVKKKFADDIDLQGQLIDNAAEFEYFYSETDKGYGFSYEIEGSGYDGAYECYLILEYIADEKAVIYDEIKYTLEK